MRREQKFADNPHAGWIVGLALGVPAVLAAMALHVPVRAGLELDTQLSEVREQLAELEVLYPLYVELLRAEPSDQWSVLPHPTRSALKQADVVDVPVMFGAMARNCGLELVSVSPHVVPGPAGKRHLKIDLQAAGPYDRMADLLLALVGMPCLDRIETVEIRRDAMHEAFKSTLWLSLN